jgi:hypothetical protein
MPLSGRSCVAGGLQFEQRMTFERGFARIWTDSHGSFCTIQQAGVLREDFDFFLQKHKDGIFA